MPCRHYGKCVFSFAVFRRVLVANEANNVINDVTQVLCFPPVLAKQIGFERHEVIKTAKFFFNVA